MAIDPATRANLELTRTLVRRTPKGSLLEAIDCTDDPRRIAPCWRSGWRRP